MYRPLTWDEYIGQSRIISNLKMYVESSLILNKPLDHIMIYGNSGMGKTSLAYLIASVMKVKIHMLNGPSLQKPSDIISVLTNIKDNEIIFIDEVHAISKEVTEILYPAIEDGNINLIIGKEYNAKNINIKLPPFTLIVATTELDRIPVPFYNRFSIFFSLENYTNEDIGKIIHNYANKIELPLNIENSNLLARYARNVPRIAINLTKRINDFYLTNNIKDIDNKFEIINALKKMDINDDGLTENDINYLKTVKKFEVLGLDNISQMINVPTKIITSIIEPHLINRGYVIRTSKGRKITNHGIEQLNKIKR